MTEAASEALKACGNCAAPARWVELAWRVKCTRPSCGVEGGKFETQREAIAAWNRRAPTPSASGERGEVEQATLQEIADGAYGDGPAMRGRARDAILARRTEVTGEGIAERMDTALAHKLWPGSDGSERITAWNEAIQTARREVERLFAREALSTLSTPTAAVEDKTYAEFQQRRGRLPDLIEEALSIYRGFMLDDDFNTQGCLDRMADKLKSARDWYDATKPTEKAGDAEGAWFRQFREDWCKGVPDSVLRQRSDDREDAAALGGKSGGVA